MKALTPKQEAIRAFIVERTAEAGTCPSHRDIAAHFGFKSPFAVACHLDALVSKGALLRDEGRARSLRPVTASKSRRRTAEIPIFGSIPAGLAENREETSEGCVAVDVEELQLKPTARTFALRVTGDSMTGRGILDGDLVLLEHGAEARHGHIVAALIDGQSTLKTYLVKNRKPFLRAENPKYPDLLPAAELMVQGVMVALIRKVR